MSHRGQKEQGRRFVPLTMTVESLLALKLPVITVTLSLYTHTPPTHTHTYTRRLDAHTKYKHQTTYVGYGESSELPVESILSVFNPGSDF